MTRRSLLKLMAFVPAALTAGLAQAGLITNSTPTTNASSGNFKATPLTRERKVGNLWVLIGPAGTAKHSLSRLIAHKGVMFLDDTNYGAGHHVMYRSAAKLVEHGHDVLVVMNTVSPAKHSPAFVYTDSKIGVDDLYSHASAVFRVDSFKALAGKIKPGQKNTDAVWHCTTLKDRLNVYRHTFVVDSRDPKCHTANVNPHMLGT